jgi:hypothetical protein
MSTLPAIRRGPAHPLEQAITDPSAFAIAVSAAFKAPILGTKLGDRRERGRRGRALRRS